MKINPHINNSDNVQYKAFVDLYWYIIGKTMQNLSGVAPRLDDHNINRKRYIMNGVYSEFAEEGLNNKKYIVYEKLNKIGGGKSFDNAKDACKYAKEILADYGFTMFKDNGETWEDVFEAELVSIGKGEVV